MMFPRFSPCLTKREERRQHRRETILDVAQESFREHGYAGSTMSEIAARLGGSKGTLWSYFPSKDELFAAVIDRATLAFQSQISLILNPHDPLEIALNHFLRELLQKVTSPEAVALYRLVIGEGQRFPEIVRIFYDRAPARTCDLLAQYLAGAMDRGELRRDDPSNTAQYFIGMCLNQMQQRALFGLIEPVEESAMARHIEHSVKTFLRAYQDHDA